MKTKFTRAAELVEKLEQEGVIEIKPRRDYFIGIFRGEEIFNDSANEDNYTEDGVRAMFEQAILEADFDLEKIK